MEASAEEKLCPRCGESVKPVPIAYRYPGPEIIEQAERGHCATSSSPLASLRASRTLSRKRLGLSDHAPLILEFEPGASDRGFGARMNSG